MTPPADTFSLKGYTQDGTEVLQVEADITQLPIARQMWNDSPFIKSHAIERIVGIIYDKEGGLEQQFERRFDGDGGYLGGTISYPDGRTLQVHNDSLEPSKAWLGELVFSVHYLHMKVEAPKPAWLAFALVLYDQAGRVYPAEHFKLPANQEPPDVKGEGATHLDAYRDLCRQLAVFEPGVLNT